MTRHLGKILVLLLFSTMLCLSSWLLSQSKLIVGYSVVTADAGMVLPVGAALFSYTNADGILVSQAGVGAVQPISSGCLFVDEAGTQTGIALVNASGQDAAVALILRDASGSEVSRKNLPLGAGHHIATFVFQQFPGLPAGFTGSLAFESDQKLAAITLRQSQNRRGEPLYTTLPVADLAAAPTEDPVVFPQIAAGDGYTTQLILINTSGRSLSGRVRFKDGNGTALALRLNGVIDSEFPYQIASRGTYRAELDRPDGIGVGYAVVTPDAGMATPVGSAVFQYKTDGYVVTEAGVGASGATSWARIYVDNVGSYTGVAIASTNKEPAEVLFTLLDSAGFAVDTVSRRLAPEGHLAVFAHELFPGLADTFTGLMEIRSQSQVNPITLKLTANQRNEQALTTLPVADMTRPTTAGTAVFPQIALGGGFSTRLIFINTSTTNATSGGLAFRQSDGTAMTLPIGGKLASQFPYQFAAGGGRQYMPGNNAGISQVLIQDPSTNQATNEVAVNEGNTVHARVLVVDSTGAPREDFGVSYSSISPEIATIDAYGVIQGNSAGFSTMTVTAGGVVTTGTITVVKVEAGVSGYEIQGIAQDSSRRLYLAATQQQTILVAQDLTKAPEVYAGRPQQAGFKDDLRKDSLFRGPSYIAFNQADATLYASEIGNHTIRRVRPGPSGRVDTLAGTGTAGSEDGPIKEARFNGPHGVALDNRGHLWVADTGNHTIRRIDLITGIVETVAGSAGSPGTADGMKEQARFSSPTGIAFASETIGQQLEREAKGLPPPPVTIVVADEGSGLIRKVSETGEVLTIGSSGASVHGAAQKSIRTPPRFAAVVFNRPEGVAVDSSGNIFVAEAGAGTVKSILQNGTVVPALQQGTLSSPHGIAAVETGRIVVAERQRFAHRFTYGGPVISSITPDKVGSKTEQRVTVRGSSFAPDTVVILGSTVISKFVSLDTRNLTFDAPALPGGMTTLTVQNRGGLAQHALFVEPTDLNELLPGYITTVAGGDTFSRDGTQARSAPIVLPESVAVDASGSLLIADAENHKVRRVDARTGLITTVAGNGQPGFTGDGVPAIAAQLWNPRGVAADLAGNVYISDSYNQRIRKVSAATGLISTIAGDGSFGGQGDGGPATLARLAYPRCVAVDDAGGVYTVDDTNRVRRISASSGIIDTVAGGGTKQPGDNERATDVSLRYVYGIAVDASGNLYIADRGSCRIRKVSSVTGIITTIAGNGNCGYSGENVPATAAGLGYPWGVAVDSDGDILLSEQFVHRIRRIAAATGIMNTIAGSVAGFDGDDGPSVSAKLYYPQGLALDAAGNLFIADNLNYRIRRISSPSGVIATVAGNGQGRSYDQGGPAAGAQLWNPQAVAIDREGNLRIADTYSHRIRKVSAAGRVITTIAGSGPGGVSGASFCGDNGLATSACLSYPGGVAVDASGNLLIADTGNNRIRKIAAATGIITTVAGRGPGGFGTGQYSGDGGLAVDAQLHNPHGVIVDSRNNIYIADSNNNRIRKIDVGTQIITTVAGGGSVATGETGPALAANLNYPWMVVSDGNGSLFFTDGPRIRKLVSSTGIISTFAGQGEAGFSGDGGPATAARLASTIGLAIDSGDSLFISGMDNRVRRVDAATGIITTVAGTGTMGCTGDDGRAVFAELGQPFGLAMDAADNLFIAEKSGQRVRAIRGPVR